MAQTFEQAVAAVTSTAVNRVERLKQIKALLDATEEAMFNSVVGGGVERYKVNTGQTVIEVESSSVDALRKQWRDLNALYEEMAGIISGNNVMVFRNASTIGR